MNTLPEENTLEKVENKISSSLRKAAQKIAPVWPLENFVAVNPYLGLTGKSFDAIAYDLAAAGGIASTLPADFYLQKIEEGIIQQQDLAEALSNKGQHISSVEFLKKVMIPASLSRELITIATVADLAGIEFSKDWNRFVTTRISNWAASYFDRGQAIWVATDKTSGLYSDWKSEAQVDLTPELTGLHGFRKLVKALPDNALEAAEVGLKALEIPAEFMEIYLHRILLKVGGWSAYAAKLDWDNKLYGGADGKLIEFLAVLISWELCLLKSLDAPTLNKKWNKLKSGNFDSKVIQEMNAELNHLLILQEAFDLANQRKLIGKFDASPLIKRETNSQPKAQAIFCLDVRSEVFRRNLELADSEIETLGFAGFFAFPINFVPIAHETGEAQCPALLPSGPTITEEIKNNSDHEKAELRRRRHHQISQVWKSFKSGAITCFSFVSPMGLSYLPKLFTDSYGITRPVPNPEKAGLNAHLNAAKSISLEYKSIENQTVGIPLQQQITMAKNALVAMSLRDELGKMVLIVGHGSSSVNNPHATGLDCGACGGHSGEANSKVAVAVLNSMEVRAGLKNDNIFIPENTIFLACLHDTTTDEVQIFDQDLVPASRKLEVEELKNSLTKAGQTSRLERSIRMASVAKTNVDKAIIHRSNDWSQTRPEWGLAGCSSFIIAPRERSKGIDFGGEAFLNSYDWKKDNDYGVLELLMTAPMVVTAWINLQYYGSTVDNKNYGSGNKTLHNITAGLGVLEGFSGDLRVGLPLQSVHDGEKFQHEPLKLNVVIEAPIEAMNQILSTHQSVRDLCDNGWINLLAMDENGKVSMRYAGKFQWETVKKAK
jgi:hypothetical protein